MHIEVAGPAIAQSVGEYQVWVTIAARRDLMLTGEGKCGFGVVKPGRLPIGIGSAQPKVCVDLPTVIGMAGRAIGLKRSPVWVLRKEVCGGAYPDDYL